MKAVKYLIFTVLVAPLLSACGAVTQPTLTPFPESMKGYELYSWQDGDQWSFSILVGTNREKTLDEIKSADTVLRGINALTSALEQMPAGQYITWSSRETLSFPPEDVIKQIEEICTNRGLLLSRAL